MYSEAETAGSMVDTFAICAIPPVFPRNTTPVWTTASLRTGFVLYGMYQRYRVKYGIDIVSSLESVKYPLGMPYSTEL
jgi:hypothetical protein